MLCPAVFQWCLLGNTRPLQRQGHLLLFMFVIVVASIATVEARSSTHRKGSSSSSSSISRHSAARGSLSPSRDYVTTNNTKKARSRPPNIIYLLADDFGWADADWHKPSTSVDPLATTNLSALIKQGIELNHHYTFKFCAPTRSAIQSGRNPIHVNVQNYQPTVWDYVRPDRDTDAGYAGIPRNMTGMASVLRSAGYETHFAGKWDCGMATPDHSPRARGYDTALFYWHHDNDYYTSRVRASDTVQSCPGADGSLLVDLWLQNTSAQQNGPALGFNNSFEKCDLHGPAGATGKPYPVDPHSGEPVPESICKFEDAIFHQHVQTAIQQHDLSKPLFIFWASHTVHTPLQVPADHYARFVNATPNDKFDARARYLAMVSWLDDAVGQTVALLRARGMWDNTLMVFSSDNGGPVYFGGTSGASNYPMRGGKASNWQ